MSNSAAGRMRIGELLVAANLITEAQLEQALQHPRKEGERLGDVLVQLGFVGETQLTQTLGQQLAVPWVSLYHVDFSRQLLDLVPRELAERYFVVPVFVRRGKKSAGETLYVAMNDPTNERALKEVAQFSGLPVKPMIACRSDIGNAIRVYYTGNVGGPDEAASDAAASDAATSDAPASSPQEAAPAVAPRAPPPPPPSRRAAVVPPPPPSAPAVMPPPEEGEPPPSSEPPASEDSPSADPEVEAREIIPKPKRGSATPMIALTLLDGTTIQIPARKRHRAASQPASGEVDPLTARDLISALRAVSHGADASEILGGEPRWESLVAALLSVLLKKGLVADWEFIEEYRKI